MASGVNSSAEAPKGTDVVMASGAHHEQLNECGDAGSRTFSGLKSAERSFIVGNAVPTQESPPMTAAAPPAGNWTLSSGAVNANGGMQTVAADALEAAGGGHGDEEMMETVINVAVDEGCCAGRQPSTASTSTVALVAASASGSSCTTAAGEDAHCEWPSCGSAPTTVAGAAAPYSVAVGGESTYRAGTGEGTECESVADCRATSGDDQVMKDAEEERPTTRLAMTPGAAAPDPEAMEVLGTAVVAEAHPKAGVAATTAAAAAVVTTATAAAAGSRSPATPPHQAPPPKRAWRGVDAATDTTEDGIFENSGRDGTRDVAGQGSRGALVKDFDYYDYVAEESTSMEHGGPSLTHVDFRRLDRSFFRRYMCHFKDDFDSSHSLKSMKEQIGAVTEHFSNLDADPAAILGSFLEIPAAPQGSASGSHHQGHHSAGGPHGSPPSPCPSDPRRPSRRRIPPR
eukprot:GHVU01085520.1.p1 GENE.GHVU01085520.1~~GHVU01085520.1.p1  ORF type:complete len:457 (+),score=78.81 GHVU01085520.1:340-1710(+)